MNAVRVTRNFNINVCRNLTANIEFSSARRCDPSKFEMYNKEYFEFLRCPGIEVLMKNIWNCEQTVAST